MTTATCASTSRKCTLAVHFPRESFLSCGPDVLTCWQVRCGLRPSWCRFRCGAWPQRHVNAPLQPAKQRLCFVHTECRDISVPTHALCVCKTIFNQAHHILPTASSSVSTTPAVPAASASASPSSCFGPGACSPFARRASRSATKLRPVISSQPFGVNHTSE